jgi:predicted amidohydrolase
LVDPTRAALIYLIEPIFASLAPGLGSIPRTPGREEIGGIRCAFFVCYDLRFADEFWPLAPKTDCYVVPANWPQSRRAHWSALLRARAIENQAYVVGVNRVGAGGKLTYAGDSVIIDPLGDELANAGDAECIVTAEVDAARVTAIRTRFPFVADRR